MLPLASRPGLLRLPLLGLLFALLAAAAEWLHLRAGVWALPPGAPFPWWIVAVYAPTFTLLLSGARRLDRRFPPAPDDPGDLGRLEPLLALALFALPMLLPRSELSLTAVIVALLLARLLRRRAPGDLVLVAGLVVLDLAIETPLLAAGLYHYPGATLLSPELALPLWAPLLWAALGLSLRRLARRVLPPAAPA